MRNKLVKQLLMVSVASSMVFGMPVISMASESKETSETEDSKEKTESNEVSEDEKDDTIKVTKNNKNPIVYDENNVKVTVQNLSYEL